MKPTQIPLATAPPPSAAAATATNPTPAPTPASASAPVPAPAPAPALASSSTLSTAAATATATASAPTAAPKPAPTSAPTTASATAAATANSNATSAATSAATATATTTSAGVSGGGGTGVGTGTGTGTGAGNGTATATGTGAAAAAAAAVAAAAASTLPSDTFVAPGLHDPLLHSTQDLFWYHVEPHFNPITEDDLDLVRVPPLQPKRAAPRQHADDSGAPPPPAPTPRQADAAAAARSQSFPLFQRLTAALVDDGRGDAVAAKPIRHTFVPEPAWIGASAVDAATELNAMLEERVRTVLAQFGLLSADHEASPLMSEIRLNCWQMRNVVSSNTRGRNELAKNVLESLESQSERRHKKLRDSQVEIRYLESLMDRGKRLKGKATKLLNQMHPNRHLTVGDRLASSQPKPGVAAANGTGGEKAIAKKRRRKSSAAHASGKSKSNPLKSKTNAAAIKGATAASLSNKGPHASPSKSTSAANGSGEHSTTDV